MKNLIFSSIAFLALASGNAQIKDLLNSKDFLWNEWEVITGSKEKSDFFDSLQFTPEGDLTNYKIVDIDGDGVADIIYSAPNQVKVHQYHNNEFKTVIDVDEELITLSRSKPWNPINVLTKDADCCESGNYALKNYQPGFENGDLIYIAENEIIINNGMELIHENLPPFKFRIRAVPELRTSPDSIAHNNVIKIYKIGDVGFALASKRGSGNQTWWMVLIPEDKHQFRAGWMRSKFLKRVF